MYSEIYLVDDMEMVNTLHQVLLRKLGVEDRVKSFTNPEEALDNLRFKLGRIEPILVLLDISMPEMTGFEFLEFMVLEDFPTHIDVVVVTSSVSEKDREMARQYGPYVKGFITKPLQLEQVTQILERTLVA
ncbi:response regulator [Muricauda sp. JGD-17]|uniref:Response regulator n=1 Tax=Flagellimonas ochracea TaxID=2696472 RepID=A0A964WW10_9FLAO|nr:response regulator [Allomuricauda ochracea]NAY90536.1 response regulator [Allomuricauda ochracea]